MKPWTALFVAMLAATAAAQRVAPPKKVKIQLETYSISVVRIESSGVTFPTLHFILVRAGQNLCDEQDTVVHELFHAMLGILRTDSLQTEHDWIYDSSTPFIDLLRENPELVKYLLQPRSPCRSNGR